MPIDYSKYPPNWFTELRPAVLQRANNRCEECGVMNYEILNKLTRKNPSSQEWDMINTKVKYSGYTLAGSLKLDMPEYTYYDIVGSRAAESLNRRLILRKNEGLDHKNKKVYPIWNWKDADTMELISKHNIKITADYRIWSRSFDGLKYQFLFGVRQYYPKDWQTLCDFFPLLPLELKRYEFNLKYFPK